MGKEMPNMAEGDPQSPTHVTSEKKEEEALCEQELRLQEKAFLRSISVHRLRPSPDQPKGRSRRGIEDLAKSLRRHGLIHPPLVRRREKGWYEIVTGHRRIEAWRLLVAEGIRDPKIRVFVAAIEDDDLVFLALAEGRHRDDFTAVEEAELAGKAWKARTRKLGREPTVRDLADVIPTKIGRTALAQSLIIARALEDQRIEHLVRQADKIGKSLLYQTLTHKDFRTQCAALKLAADGGAASEVKAVLRPKRTGRPMQVVTRKERGGVNHLSVRIWPSMEVEEIDKAIEALESAVAELKVRRSGASS